MTVRLRPLREEDAAPSVRWRHDPDVWTYTLAAGRPGPGPTLEDEIAWIRRVTADPTGRRFAILAEGTYVGNVSLTGIAEGAAEYHIHIGDRNWWGRGVARAATLLVLDHGWDELDLDSVHLVVHPDNVAALRLYDSLGFTREGMDGAFIRMRLARPAERSRREERQTP